MTAPAICGSTPKVPRRKLVKRAPKEHSQTLRHLAQLGFLAVNVWIGVEFYRFVRYYETGGRTAWTHRPPGVEGWLPIASLMNLKVWWSTGQITELHPAGMFLLLAFVAMSWIFRKSFCSWLCPMGSISEYLWRLGRETFGRNFRLPRWLDIPARGLKYILLGLFVYAVASMPVEAIRAFLQGPYGIVDDVKMLNFFRFLGLTGGVLLAVLVIASVFVQNFWCRYLCPYGALLGMAALASPLRIRRNANLCIDCGKCAKACPSVLPVDQLVSIRSAECTGCLQCVDECPAAGALMFAAPRRRRVPAWAVAAGITILFSGICGYARWSGHWDTQIPERLYFELVPQVNDFEHP